MVKGSIDSIESLGLYDGPGIRVVVFLNGCKLRCKYCHNPEMWQLKEGNITSVELVEKIKRYKVMSVIMEELLFLEENHCYNLNFLLNVVKN